MLTVIRPATKEEVTKYFSRGQKKKKPLWLCKCDCGTEVLRTSSTLYTGEWYKSVQNCGCRSSNKYREKYDSFIGQRFGKLTIVSYDDSCGETVFTCKCDCGNETTSDLYSITSGHKKSCGCILEYTKKVQLKDNKRINLIGQKFGKLTVLSETDRRDMTGCVIWECLCECGNITYQATHPLISGSVQSCGCIKSKGEMVVALILSANNIRFQKQYWFNDLRSSNNRPLMFDFAIFNEDGSLSHLIEYDGVQHFIVHHSGWNTKENHDVAIRRDKIKNEYCMLHGIPLIRIPYTRFDDLCLEDLLLQSTDFLCAG